MQRPPLKYTFVYECLSKGQYKEQLESKSKVQSDYPTVEKKE